MTRYDILESNNSLGPYTTVPLRTAYNRLTGCQSDRSNRIVDGDRVLYTLAKYDDTVKITVHPGAPLDQTKNRVWIISVGYTNGAITQLFENNRLIAQDTTGGRSGLVTAINQALDAAMSSGTFATVIVLNGRRHYTALTIGY